MTKEAVINFSFYFPSLKIFTLAQNSWCSQKLFQMTVEEKQAEIGPILVDIRAGKLHSTSCSVDCLAESVSVLFQIRNFLHH